MYALRTQSIPDYDTAGHTQNNVLTSVLLNTMGQICWSPKTSSRGRSRKGTMYCGPVSLPRKKNSHLMFFGQFKIFIGNQPPLASSH